MKRKYTLRIIPISVARIPKPPKRKRVHQPIFAVGGRIDFDGYYRDEPMASVEKNAKRRNMGSMGADDL